jgi:hypothetical protein
MSRLLGPPEPALGVGRAVLGLEKSLVLKLFLLSDGTSS